MCRVRQGVYEVGRPRETSQATARPETAISCHVCIQRFQKNCLLNNHIREAHTKERFYCDKCGEGYRQKQGLTKHVKSVHAPPKPRQIFQCVCWKTFTELGLLTQHKIIHAAPKYHCEWLWAGYPPRARIPRSHGHPSKCACLRCGRMFKDL